MARKKRNWHPDFVKYMEFIVSHPNYKEMPYAYKDDGTIRWIVAGKSEIGQARLKWWDKKREELSIPKEGKWISKVARKIHPLGEKPCQVCGKVMKLDYVYKNKRGTLSPGAMSNAPDRFDGYHSYNQCCRSKEDTGRHKENLQRYGEDRRAYEFWVDGDWKAASWLMQEFRKNKVSPDHIGPISLGFSHRPRFNPMSASDNSAKNNRMTLDDVKFLLKDEEKGEMVVSWHSKFIWDKLKHKVKSSEDSLKLSKLMRQNMHYVLRMLYVIHKEGHSDFLVKNFLHPEYAKFSISFENFNHKDGTFTKIIKIEGDKKQYTNNAERYVRKSLLSLEKYEDKKNRRVIDWEDKELDKRLEIIVGLLKQKKEEQAKEEMSAILKLLAEKAEKKFSEIKL